MCLYMSSSMFTFRNNVSQQMGGRSRLNVRRTARGFAARLLYRVPLCKPSTAAGKKKRGEAERDGLPYPNGG